MIRFKFLFLISCSFFFTNCSEQINKESSLTEKEFEYQEVDSRKLGGGYYEIEGKVFLGEQPGFRTEVYDADPETFEYLGEGFFRDSEAVYWQSYIDVSAGSGIIHQRITEFDPQKFAPINDEYFKHEGQIYLAYNGVNSRLAEWVIGDKYELRPQFDSETLQPVEKCYLADKNGIYDYNTEDLITSKTLDQVEIFDEDFIRLKTENCYLNDGNFVYFGKEKTDFDPESFEIIEVAFNKTFKDLLMKDDFKYEFLIADFEIFDLSSFRILEDSKYFAEDDYINYLALECFGYESQAAGHCRSSVFLEPKSDINLTHNYFNQSFDFALKIPQVYKVSHHDREIFISEDSENSGEVPEMQIRVFHLDEFEYLNDNDKFEDLACERETYKGSEYVFRFSLYECMDTGIFTDVVESFREI